MNPAARVAQPTAVHKCIPMQHTLGLLSLFLLLLMDLRQVL